MQLKKMLVVATKPFPFVEYSFRLGIYFLWLKGYSLLITRLSAVICAVQCCYRVVCCSALLCG